MIPSTSVEGLNINCDGHNSPYLCRKSPSLVRFHVHVMNIKVELELHNVIADLIQGKDFSHEMLSDPECLQPSDGSKVILIVMKRTKY